VKFELFNNVSCKKIGQNLARFFKFKTLVFGDTVTKKDFTASFKSKKEEVFESSRTKIWHEIKANVLTFWGQVLL
jgi:hypothetical protein